MPFIAPFDKHNKRNEIVHIIGMTQLTKLSALGFSMFLNYPVVSILFQRSFNCVGRGIT